MLNIFILEDNLIQQGRIEKAIADISAKNGWEHRDIQTFSKPQALLDAINERGSHQFYFLDIEIKGEEKKGLEVAQEIRETDPTATIVFVTTHSEFMPVTFKYKVAALDFIDKGRNEESYRQQIEESLAMAIKNITTTVIDDSFFYESPQAMVQVPFSTILYFESLPGSRKVVLYTKDERIEFTAKITELAKLDDRLFRCYVSFVVNPANITRVDKENRLVYFENGECCDVSRRYMKALLKKIEEVRRESL